jgi:glutamyl-tRNA reductase
MRREAAVRVESIVDEEFERLLAQYKRKRADEVISAMYEGAEQIKAQELETALGKLDMDEEDRQVIESMADAIVSQLLAAPTDSLRDAAEADDWSTIHTALRLFNPHVSPEESPVSDEMPFTSNTPADASPDEIPDHVREQLPAGVLDQFE